MGPRCSSRRYLPSRISTRSHGRHHLCHQRDRSSHQRVTGLVHVIKAHVAHPCLHHTPHPVLKRFNQFVCFGILLLSGESLNCYQVLQETQWRETGISSGGRANLAHQAVSARVVSRHMHMRESYSSLPMKLQQIQRRDIATNFTFCMAAMSPLRQVSSSHDKHLCSPPAPVWISLTTTPTEPIRRKLPSFSSYDFAVPFP